jgi:hypothetical protein
VIGSRYPGRRPNSHVMLGMTLESAGRTLVLNGVPGSPILTKSLTDRDRTGVPAAWALAGTWLPRSVEPMVLINPELTATPGPQLTNMAQVALSEGRYLMSDATGQEAARCIPQRPPLNMSFREPKQFNVGNDEISIRVVPVGETERIIHMENVPAAQENEQGLSVGRWDGDALEVSTTFASDVDSERGLINGVPIGGDTELHERFELSEDRRTLAYTYTVENPDYLVEPFSISTEWAYRPDLEIPQLECDPEVAERFLDDL